MPNNLEATPSLASWLRHLSQLMPPTGAVVVGAGGGTWLKTLSALRVEFVDCIEADEKQAYYLHPLLERHPGWRLHQALVWSEERELTYHIASNPAENGVIEPETLATIWPNLTTRSREPRQTVTLRHVLHELPAERQPNWLIIDCLPAQPILQGLGEQLAHFDVIVARCLAVAANPAEMSEADQTVCHAPPADVTMSAQAPSNTAKTTLRQANILGLSWQALESMLVADGYLCLIATPERQPTIVHTLYIRDWRAMEKATQLALNAQLDERQRQLDEVCQHRLQLQHINADCEAGQRLLNQEIEKAQTQLDAYKQNLTRVSQEKTSLAVQLEASLKQAADRLQQNNELHQQIQSLQASVANSAARQHLMQEEMARAEAQIDLIKEMLLAEPVK